MKNFDTKTTKMAEEDEVDIVGDFNLDGFLSKNESNLVSQNTDLLNCDYTIHPQWLLDRPSANPDNWYDSNTTAEQNENTGHVSTENCITDESGWTEKEKNLLDRGIGIFHKSNVRLSQFIGSKTASEVEYYLKNFYVENQPSYSSNCLLDENNLFTEVLNDTQIPASIEEVIAAVSTAKPTVQMSPKKSRKKSVSFNSTEPYTVNMNDIPSGASLLKSNYLKLNSDFLKPKIKRNKVKNKKIKQNNRGKAKSAKFKFKTRIKLADKVEKVKRKTLKTLNENKRPISKIEITTGKGLSVPLCEGEEIVKIKKDEESDTDIEVDVEDIDDSSIIKSEPILIKHKIPKYEKSPGIELVEPIIPKTEKKLPIKEEEPNPSNNELHNRQLMDLSSLDEETAKQLMSRDLPTKEIELNPQEITNLEKSIHSEFFKDSPSKTPNRYLVIRNHILNAWKNKKPSYCTKTSIRQGLRNFGNVNCMGRIHYYLEQIGAINFGCRQVKYSRPLYDMLQTIPTVTKEKPSKILPVSRNIEVGSRPRMKKKFSNDGEGGCTLQHDEKGTVINTTIVNEDPVLVKPRPYVKKPSIRLIYCRPFGPENPQKYTVNLHLSALLKMDFHAHTNLTEVMGLVAGYWNPTKKMMTITQYETCKNIASSATHCDMCPISQAKAAENIHDKGLDILGWFHSHPTFAPEPSQQDLETQQSVQQWIGIRKPCIGVILSPFSLNGALIGSPYRCMVVDKKLNFEDQCVPYKFVVNVISDGFSPERFLNDIQEVIFLLSDCKKEEVIDFSQPYFQDTSITYLDKFIYSVRMHLAKCGDLSKMTCDYIIQGLTDICGNN